ncbi:serine hydrolase domain-containing protein [Aeromicrobium wangtongii]|uniref:serine hydrolase domain-containing protein n=1 Tax=Aeromicrobium wangtongii TaxID=2969247 RepID=UPI0020177AFB|nr:serine hydrolase domain-containing protein [Aeromicrobium wangtongii]MCL3819398.1 beta-lactamase family protein [Aeromicrobium wangtongii]
MGGTDRHQLARLRASIEADVEAGRCDGAVVLVGHHGEIVLEEAIGSTDVTTGRPARVDDVFRVMSLTKSLTNGVAFVALNQGRLALNTRVVELVPEFAVGAGAPDPRRARVTVGDLLSHRSALPTTIMPLPPERVGCLAEVVAKICAMELLGEPGETLSYAAAVNHALLAEMVRRAYGADRFRDVLVSELLDPLGMTSTALGLPHELADRAVPIRVCSATPSAGGVQAADLEIFNSLVTTEAEMPWVGGVSTAPDVFRMAEMFRRGGEIDGVRVLSPALLDTVTVNRTGEQVNSVFAEVAGDRAPLFAPAPGYLSFGFSLSGPSTAPSMFGTLTSPSTYGNFGAGSGLFWVDPERDLTFVFLSAGLMPEPSNLFRFQRLSDLAATAAW